MTDAGPSPDARAVERRAPARTRKRAAAVAIVLGLAAAATLPGSLRTAETVPPAPPGIQTAAFAVG